MLIFAVLLHVLTWRLLTTIDYNLTHGATARVFQRKVSNTSVSPEALTAFRALSTRKSQELLEEYDAWLARHEAQENEDLQSAGHYVSVGISHFDDTLNEDPEP